MISIIIPCFNAESFIERAVESAFNQLYDNIEVICIDNNSTDNTSLKLKDLKVIFPGLIVGVEKKHGASAARNKGLSLASGTWVQFLDADDYLLPGKILNQSNYIEPGLSFIIGNYYHLKGDEKEEIIYKNDKNIFALLSSNRIGNTCSNLFNRHYLDKVNGWDESLRSSQEAELMYRLLLENKRVYFSDKNETVVVQNAESISVATANQYLNLVRRVLFTIEIFKNRANYELSAKDEYFIRNSLYTTIRELYFFEPKKAVALNRRYFPNGFNLKTSGANSFYYVIIYKLFGFSFANLLSQIPKLLRRDVRY